MSVHHSEPKFKVGDMVSITAQKLARKVFPPHEWEKSTFHFIHISQVITETCPGGTQHHYVGRPAFVEAVCKEAYRFNEIELEPAPTGPIESK